MPAAVVGPAIMGAASLGGALIGHKGNKAALKSQERSQREALQFEREQMAKDEAAARKREELYERQMNMWQQRQDALLGRYGIKSSRAPFSVSGPPMSGGMPPGPPGMAVSNRGPVRLKSVGLAPQMRQLVNPYDLGGWGDA